ncbi:MAG TPA: zf-HC2 domain-containing protein [Candidatus Eisenbacteria bacterium]|nr:zf-HC2 domain-containing protein [Candidatus Eisenbacteria bacterium]
MSDRWTDLVSEYLDGCMEPATRRDMEAHLQTCTECSATLEDLRGIVARAAALPAPAASPEIWAGIEARLRAAAEAPAALRPARPRAARVRTAPWASWRISLTLPQLAAACVAVIALSGGLAYVLTRPGENRDLAAVPITTRAAETLETSDAAIEDIAELRRILAAGRDQLDPATVRSLEESLIAIDTAIRQGRTALQADPQNPYVRDHLDDTMRRKVDLLRRATQLASATE